MAELSSGAENVLAVSFAEESNAYAALTILKELDSQKQVDLYGAAVVARNADGHLSVKDQIGDVGVTDMAGGGLIGLLIGIIGGPLGILIGGTTGLLVGSLFDLQDADDTQSVLADISQSVRPGRTALLVDVSEPSPEVIDSAMARLTGSVLRRPVDEVEAEIAAAEKAQHEAKKKARKELREARHEKHKKKVHAKVEEMKEKLHPDKQDEKVAAPAA